MIFLLFLLGDVIFILKPPAQEPSIFTRSGSDLTCKKEITLIEALSGARFVIKHLDGRELLISTNEIVQPGITIFLFSLYDHLFIVFK